MPINFGNSGVNAIFQGSTSISKVYHGDTLVFVSTPREQPEVVPTYSAWRINSLGTRDAYCSIAEVELRTIPGGPDRLDGKSLIAYQSSEYGVNNSVYQAFDNNPNTLWSSRAGDTMGWISVGIDIAIPVREVMIQATINYPAEAPSGIVIEGSYGGGTGWVFVKEFRDLPPWSSGEQRTFSLV